MECPRRSWRQTPPACCRAAVADETLGDLRVLDGQADFFRNPVDDLPGCPGGRHEPGPQQNLEPRESGLRQARNIRKLRNAFLARHPEQPDGTARRLREHDREIGEEHVDVPCDNIRQRRGPTLVHHRDHLEARLLEKQDRRQMDQAAGSDRHIGELFWLPTRVIDQFRDGIGWNTGMRDQDQRIGSDIADRDEVLRGIIGRLRHRRDDCDFAERRHEQGVAVGRGARDRVGGDGAGGARAILHHELAPEHLAETLRDDAGNRVGISPGPIRHHDPHRPLRPALGVRGSGQAECDQEGRECER